MQTMIRQKHALCDKLKIKRDTAPLFDTARTTRNMERAYKMIWQRYCDGLPPANMQVIEDSEVATAA